MRSRTNVSSAPLLGLLFLLLFSSSASSSSSFRSSDTHTVKSPVSRVDVQLSQLAERVSVAHRHPSGLSAHLFEWDPEHNVVHSSHHRLDLGNHLHARTVRHATSTEIFVNNLPYTADTDALDGDVEAVITTSADSSVDAVFHSGDLIHVWGANGLRLSPLNHHHTDRVLFVAERMPGMPDSSRRDKMSMDPEEEDELMEMIKTNITETLLSPEPSFAPEESPSDILPSLAPEVGNCASGIPHYVEIAMAYDNSLCRFYKNSPSRTLAMIAVLMEVTSRPFLQDTCVRPALTFLDGHCQDANDPYAPLRSLSSVFLGFSFVSIWAQSERTRAVPRDIAFFISGFNDGTSILGFSFPGRFGGMCNPSLSFGWCEGIIPGVLGHELGQALNARRIDTGLMQSFYEPGIVIPRLAPQSIAEITDFVDSESPFASCISTTPPANPLVPITTIVPEPTILPEYGTCDVSRRSYNVLTCTQPRTVGIISPPAMLLPRIGKLRVLSWQDFGVFHVDVKVIRRNGAEIREFRGVQHLNATFVNATLGLNFRDDGRDRNATIISRLDRESIRIRWPRPSLTCCDRRLYIMLRVKWCLKSSVPPNEVCATVFKRLSRQIPCRSPCFGHRGRVLKMSSERRCPTCATF